MNVVPNFSRIGEENAFAVLARANELASQGRDIINLGIGQPDFKTAPHIVEATVKALYDGHHGYTDAPGIAPLRRAVADDLLRRYNAVVSPEQVMIMPGGKPAMFAAILLFGEPGVEIIYPDPGFPIYRSLIEFSGATAVPLPLKEMNQFAFVADDVLSRLNDKTKLLILNSPANPCGSIALKSELDMLVKGLARFPAVTILADEIYDQLIYEGEHISLLTYPEIASRLILLNGWSKTYAMTGWRLGYSVWPTTLFDYVRKLAVNAWSCVNTPAQYGALAALTGSQTVVEKMRRVFNERRLTLVKQLNAIENVSCVMPKGAFYAFVNISQTGWRSKALATALLEEAGIATVSGTDFGLFGEGYLRISYANSTDNICRAIARLADFLGNHPAPNFKDDEK